MPILNVESLDDPMAFDGTSDFSGGQASYARATALQPNQSTLVHNFTLNVTGELRKRHGTANVAREGLTVASASQKVQALIYFDTVESDRLVAFSGGNAYFLNVDHWASYFTAAITDPEEMISVTQLTDHLFWTDTNKTGIRHWDGATVTVADSPIASLLITHTNRLVASGVATVPDAIYFSDILDGTSWEMGTQSIRIGGGDGDPIIAIQGWQDALLLVFKRGSTYLIDMTPTLTVANFSVKCIHQSLGCIAKRSVAQVGQDVFFLSRNGVQSVQKQLATSNNQITIPISLPIHDVIESINWAHAHKSIAIFYKNQYMLVIPCDSNEPDTMIVFNTTTGGWSVCKDLEIISLAEQPIDSRSRLVGGDSNGYVFESLDYQDESDETPDTFTDGEAQLAFPVLLPTQFPYGRWVNSKARSRSYVFAEPLNYKTGWYAEIEFKEREGQSEIWAIFDGKDIDAIKLGDVEFFPAGALIPFILPVLLPLTGWQKRIFPIYGPNLPAFKEIQIEVRSSRGDCIVRNIALSAFIDTMEFQ